LQAIREKHDPKIEVKAFLDHARYNQAKIRRSFANTNNLELVFFTSGLTQSKPD
jgi:hypothetical protein